MSLRRLTKNCGFAPVIAFLFLFGSAAFAQTPNPVSLSARLEPAQIKQGQSAKVLITARIDPGWHLYSLTQPPGGPIPTKITIDEGGPLVMDGKPQQPKPKEAVDPNFTPPGGPDFITQTFEKEVTFTVPVKAAPGVPTGALKATVKIRFQVCDEHQCLPPKSRPLEVEGTILAANAAPTPGQTQIAATKATPIPATSVSPSITPAASPSATPENVSGKAM
ncbi:MAG: protein-disulfide reductase DsbD N-terminal domain-containing protein, partial [Blastocatellia bacterium]|nr:protein-disulfide reductase DsbD N-terminal domain-containing protein [Blastocatellia bacterium]